MENSPISQKVHFETLGCRLNQAESEGAARFFSDAGFEIDFSSVLASQKEAEDVFLCIINTCTVTAKAEQKARRIIRLLLQKFPLSAVLVTGCYAELDYEEIASIDDCAEKKRIFVLRGREKSRLSELPAVIKNAKGDVFSSISEFLKDSKIENESRKIVSPFTLSTNSFFDHSRATLKIQDGCDCVCTYCRIRLARGKSESLSADEVVRRVQELENAHYAEVVLSSVNGSLYRSKITDADGNTKTIGFSSLLRIILEKTQKIGIRISSLYPGSVDEEFAEVAKNPRVRPHFHISLQSGSDSILSKMKRPYTVQNVKNAVSLLKNAKKDPFFSCDVIAGFPGETEADFSLTMKLLEECGFTSVHAFPFSARPGTEAFSMRPKIPSSISKKRVSILEDFSNQKKEAFIARQAGKIVCAVTENVRRSRSPLSGMEVHALTENFLHCVLLVNDKTRIPKAGSEVRVKIVRPLSKSEKTGELDAKAELV